MRLITSFIIAATAAAAVVDEPLTDDQHDVDRTDCVEDVCEVEIEGSHVHIETRAKATNRNVTGGPEEVVLINKFLEEDVQGRWVEMQQPALWLVAALLVAIHTGAVQHGYGEQFYAMQDIGSMLERRMADYAAAMGDSGRFSSVLAFPNRDVLAEIISRLVGRNRFRELKKNLENISGT